ncbi:PadR family transcriptional regulator, regulatory protein PadR [Cyclobacterium lianum]|uniref:PadR family transcriptional regulator, regulatory protein PadR n=2 Tax=Cyclobacterium lianum TaxID=388280 RepID=A0A1M7NF24_9BACT|nr:PadR family transcriptional regulator, regulatory protein PadR [Cyclobacterium lianum]
MYKNKNQKRKPALVAKFINTEKMKASNTQTQMRKGILEFCILHIIARGEVYATDMIDELKNAQLIIVEGTLYPLLNRLKTSGLASYKWVESETGPPRKYYSITPEGNEFLKQLDKTWSDLDNSVNQILNHQKKP